MPMVVEAGAARRPGLIVCGPAGRGLEQGIDHAAPPSVTYGLLNPTVKT